MIMSDKTQCRHCKQFGRVKNLPDWCCIAIDEKDHIDFEKAARRSNCWCLDWQPENQYYAEKLLNNSEFHRMGRELTETFGTGIKIEKANTSLSRKYTPGLRLRVTYFYHKDYSVTVIFSIDGDKETYSYSQLLEILKNHKNIHKETNENANTEF